MTPEEIQALFTRSDGRYHFARWGRPIAPVVFGVADETLGVVKGAIEAVVVLAGHRMAETDPELGANLMVFFFRDWRELPDVPNLSSLIEGLEPLVARLDATGANQYRIFRFDKTGAIRAAFVFIRMDDALAETPAQTLALQQAAQTILMWSDTGLAKRSLLAQAEGHVVLHPDIAALIRAAYSPVLPACTTDASHALRLAARLSAD